MKRLHLGDSGPDVRELQTKLIAAGYSLQADGVFGGGTDRAVRAFQIKRGLLTDGVAGEKTQLALEQAGKGIAADLSLSHLLGLLSPPVILAALVARTHSPLFAPLFGGRSASPKQLYTSEKGIEFIYKLEAWPGRSNILHWPGEGSGVTLGPGYDMKERTAQEISTDLQAIGIPKDTANKVAQAARLWGEQAKEFVAKFNKDNPKLVDLDKIKERSLLKHILPAYETRVKRTITIDLYQHQFDALVSFAYNPAGVWPRVANYINRHMVRDALDLINSKTKSKGKVMKGLVDRRQREVALYLHGDYGQLPTIG